MVYAITLRFSMSASSIESDHIEARSGFASAVYASAKVLSCLLVGRGSRFRVVAGQHLRAMPLPLSDHADVEPGVEQLGGRELPERDDGPVEGDLAESR
jgi:hypothetical protein